MVKKGRFSRTQEYMIGIIIGVFVFIFTLTLRDWMRENLTSLNIFGLDPDLFLLIITGIIIILLVYFGFIKEG